VLVQEEEEEEENAGTKPSAAQEGEEQARSIRPRMPFAHLLRLLPIRHRWPCAWLQGSADGENTAEADREDAEEEDEDESVRCAHLCCTQMHYGQ
jgi:hypothetical protein